MGNQKIFKTKKNGKYVTIHNDFFDVTHLSLKAKALLCSLLSRPSNWQVRINHLVKCSTDGRHSVESGLNELIKYGYVHREKLRNEKGEFIDTAYYVFEDPSLNMYWDEKNQTSTNPPSSSADNYSEKDNNDKYTNSKSQGVAPPSQNPQEINEPPAPTASSVKPDGDNPSTENQESEKPVSGNHSHSNKHTSNSKTHIQKHTPTNAGEEVLVSTLTETMQVLCGLRQYQIDEVQSWLNDNPDKLKSFNQWFHTNIRLNLSDKNSGIENPAGYSWYRLKGVLNGEISISNDDSKTDVDIIHRLNFEDEKPDTEGLKRIADLFKDSDLKKYFNQGGRN